MGKYTSTIIRHVPLLLLIIIICVAAYLRLYRIADYMTFLGDEGRDVLVVKRMLVDHKWTLLGPTASVGGFFLGPAYYYFMLPFLWAWNLNPVGPAVMVALFGVVTVGLVYVLGRSLFSVRVGLVAAALYSLSPLVIAYSRSSWNPNLVPFFTSVLLILLWKSRTHSEWWIFFGIGLCMGLGIQMHYLFIFLFPVIGIWMWIFRTTGQKIWQKVFFVCMGFIAGYAPFLAFELRHQFPNTRTIIRFLAEGKDVGFTLKDFIATISDVVYRSFSRLLVRYPQEEIWSKYENLVLWFWTVGTKFILFSGIAVLVGYAAGILSPGLSKQQSPIRKYRHASLLLLLWFGIVILLFGFYRRGIYDYYFGIIFPFPFLLFGVLLDAAVQIRRLKPVMWIIAGILLYCNWQGRPFVHPANRQLAQARSIAHEVFTKTNGKPFNFALVADHNSDHAYRYFFEIWGNPPVVIENEIIDPERSTVTDQLLVICELRECRPLGHPLWEIAGFGQADIAGTWDVSFVKVHKLIHTKGEL